MNDMTVFTINNEAAVKAKADYLYDKMFQDYPDIVNIEQLREMLGVGRNTAYSLLKNNEIRSIRIGRVHKVPKINIIKYLQEKH